MLLAVNPVAHISIALHDEALFGKGTEIIKAIEISSYLSANSFREFRIIGFEHRPSCRFGDRIDELQTESSHRQARKFTTGL